MSIPLVHPPNRAAAPVWTVSQLTAQIKDLLETGFSRVWVAGEISKLTQHASGHIYLTLKDDRAVISAKIWKTAASRIAFELRVGLEVIAQGRLSVWEPRGEYSIVIEQVQPKGVGAWELAFRQLCEKLQKEGLFAPEHKKPLPKFPRRIVLVTSPTGAAVRDMLHVIGRRWRDIEVWIRPVRVQGDGAGAEIARAIAEVNRLRHVDVMIVGRGGGSMEDLWAFNEEVVARAIFHSRIPVVSAVGHEVNWTVADYVADVRAPTPSAAAEIVVPSEADVRQHLNRDVDRMVHALQNRLRTAQRHFAQLAIRRPFRLPFELVFQRQQRCDELAGRADRAIRSRLREVEHRLARLAGLLEGLSPLNVLARGYSLTTRDDGRTVVRNAEEVCEGDRLLTRLARGRLWTRVEQKSLD